MKSRHALLLLLGTAFLLSCNKNGDEVRGKEESKNVSKSESDPKTKSESFAGQIPIADVQNFIDSWCRYQSQYEISSYLNCYSKDFLGVKRTNSGKAYIYDYDKWVEDRIKMYSSAEDLSVSAFGLNVKSYSNVDDFTLIEFEQYYYSKKYSDKGRKVMKLRRSSDGEIKIIFEELLDSEKLSE